MNPSFTEKASLAFQRTFNTRRRAERQAWLLCRVLKLHQQGLTTRAMSLRLGCHRSRVEQLMVELNLVANDARGAP